MSNRIRILMRNVKSFERFYDSRIKNLRFQFSSWNVFSFFIDHVQICFRPRQAKEEAKEAKDTEEELKETKEKLKKAEAQEAAALKKADEAAKAKAPATQKAAEQQAKPTKAAAPATGANTNVSHRTTKTVTASDQVTDYTPTVDISSGAIVDEFGDNDDIYEVATLDFEDDAESERQEVADEVDMDSFMKEVIDDELNDDDLVLQQRGADDDDWWAVYREFYVESS